MNSQSRQWAVFAVAGLLLIAPACSKKSIEASGTAEGSAMAKQAEPTQVSRPADQPATGKQMEPPGEQGAAESPRPADQPAMGKQMEPPGEPGAAESPRPADLPAMAKQAEPGERVRSDGGGEGEAMPPGRGDRGGIAPGGGEMTPPSSLGGETGPATSGPGQEPLKGFEAVKPGQSPSDERIGGGGQMIAKVAPSEPPSKQAEDLRREQAATTKAGLQDAYFAFDSWKITEDAKKSLDADGEWLKSNTSDKVMVEGHCDERGTQAYNLVLGERRAKAAKNYLTQLGVAGNRLSTTSYGKDRPVCKEQNEECYQKNRRAHLVVR
jgi:peptidoglycan-associated lipoprotein